MYFCDRSGVQLSPQSHLWTQTSTGSQGPCAACQNALESLHTLCNTQTRINKHTCTCTGMKLCACTHVPQQALNKQTVSIQRSPKKWKHITMLKLTYAVQVKQEKGVLVPLEKQGFSRKLAFLAIPLARHIYTNNFKCAQCSQKTYSKRFPWGLPYLNMHFNPVSRTACP